MIRRLALSLLCASTVLAAGLPARASAAPHSITITIDGQTTRAYLTSEYRIAVIPGLQPTVLYVRHGQPVPANSGVLLIEIADKTEAIGDAPPSIGLRETYIPDGDMAAHDPTFALGAQSMLLLLLTAGTASSSSFVVGRGLILHVLVSLDPAQ
jgi:hypothetical protein